MKNCTITTDHGEATVLVDYEILKPELDYENGTGETGGAAIHNVYFGSECVTGLVTKLGLLDQIFEQL